MTDSFQPTRVNKTTLRSSLKLDGYSGNGAPQRVAETLFKINRAFRLRLSGLDWSGMCDVLLIDVKLQLFPLFAGTV